MDDFIFKLKMLMWSIDYGSAKVNLKAKTIINLVEG